MMFFLTQAIYQAYNGFTGTSLYEYWSGSVINVIFCALCIIFLGMFEQDLQASTLLAVPELYRRGQHNGSFNLKKYAWWNFMALVDAFIIYYFVHLAYGLAQQHSWLFKPVEHSVRIGAEQAGQAGDEGHGLCSCELEPRLGRCRCELKDALRKFFAARFTKDLHAVRGAAC